MDTAGFGRSTFNMNSCDIQDDISKNSGASALGNLSSIKATKKPGPNAQNQLFFGTLEINQRFAINLRSLYLRKTARS